MKGLYTAGTLLGLTAMLGGSAFAAKPAPAAPKTAVKSVAKPAAKKTAAKPAAKKMTAKTTASKHHAKTAAKHRAKKSTKHHAKKGKAMKHSKRASAIGPARAEKVALARYHGRVMGRPVLENERGRRDYEVKLMSGKTEREVAVNANTGRIDGARIMTSAERGHKTAARPMARKNASKPVARKAATKPMAKTATKTASHTKTAAKAATHKS